MSAESNGLKKYLRVFPIFGLLFYYVGGLITSLDVSDSIVYIVQIVAFSILLFAGLYLLDKRVMIVGAVVALVGTAGSVFFMLQNLGEATLGLGAVGGAFSLIADLFFLLTIYAWARQPS
ncbi:hypothetical protein EU546_02800 [Candidatus Thorarchaeota archaeon]|nr:MAG: hypothetical protein EU546_02800 [Candidatus Thorarchaeota archaeon]